MFDLSFASMLAGNSVPFTLYRQAGPSNIYQNGDWVKPTNTPETVSGMFAPYTDDDLRYGEAGTYDVKDKKLYVLFEIPLGAEIEYNGIKYTVQQFKDYREYVDVYIYIARFAEGGEEQ